MEKEIEICATNITNKTKRKNTNAPVILCVIHHRQNPSESTYEITVFEQPKIACPFNSMGAMLGKFANAHI
jgi:hypothetical protein